MRSKYLNLCLISVALSFTALTSVHAEQDIEQIVVFGDSLSDPGNAFAVTGSQSVPPYQLIPDAAYAIGGHHFSNGKTWVEVFAKELDEKSKPAFRNRKNTNFAVGGSRARDEGSINLSTQVAAYLSTRAEVTDDESDDEILYVIFIGGNDIRDAIVALATDPSGATSGLILQQAITSISDNLAALVQAGAYRFLIVNAPDLSLTPAVRLQGPGVQFAANLLSKQFNQGLAQLVDGYQLAFPIEITEFDLFTLFSALAQNQEALVLSDTESTCIMPGVIKDAVCMHPEMYLFWDGIHPTKRVHKFIGKYASDFYDDDNSEEDYSEVDRSDKKRGKDE